MLQVSTSLVEERVIGPSCLPAALGPTLVPIHVQRFFAEATSPEGEAMGRDEATLHVATDVTKAFGYDLEVNLVLHKLRSISVKHLRQRHAYGTH